MEPVVLGIGIEAWADKLGPGEHTPTAMQLVQTVDHSAWRDFEQQMV